MKCFRGHLANNSVSVPSGDMGDSESLAFADEAYSSTRMWCRHFRFCPMQYSGRWLDFNVDEIGRFECKILLACHCQQCCRCTRTPCMFTKVCVSSTFEGQEQDWIKKLREKTVQCVPLKMQPSWSLASKGHPWAKATKGTKGHGTVGM